MTASVPAGGPRTQQVEGGNAPLRLSYRVAICVFPDGASALSGLGQIFASGVGMSDMAVIVPSRGEAEALLSRDKACPAVFVRGQDPGEPEWLHMGPPASYTARRLADIPDWASERTTLAMNRDLSQSRLVLLVYALRSVLQTLPADVLLHLDVLRVEVHDIPPSQLAS